MVIFAIATGVYGFGLIASGAETAGRLREFAGLFQIATRVHFDHEQVARFGEPQVHPAIVSHPQRSVGVERYLLESGPEFIGHIGDYLAAEPAQALVHQHRAADPDRPVPGRHPPQVHGAQASARPARPVPLAGGPPP